VSRYYIPKGRAFGYGRGLVKPGDPIPPLTAEQIARFVADGSLAIKAPEPKPEPPSYKIPRRLPRLSSLAKFLKNYDDADHVRAIWRSDDRSSSTKIYRARIRELS